jgi:hypothetical protein
MVSVRFNKKNFIQKNINNLLLKGIQLSNDGSLYEGDFNKDKKSGNGIYKFRDEVRIRYYIKLETSFNILY